MADVVPGVVKLCGKYSANLAIQYVSCVSLQDVHEPGNGGGPLHLQDEPPVVAGVAKKIRQVTAKIC